MAQFRDIITLSDANSSKQSYANTAGTCDCPSTNDGSITITIFANVYEITHGGISISGPTNASQSIGSASRSVVFRNLPYGTYNITYGSSAQIRCTSSSPIMTVSASGSPSSVTVSASNKNPEATMTLDTSRC